MANAIIIIKLLISLGPDLIKFIKSIEELMPESGQGVNKLAIIRGYMESAWSGFGTALPAFEEFWPKLNLVITALVNTFNTIGIFKK